MQTASQASGAKDLSSFVRLAVLNHMLRTGNSTTDDIASLRAKFVDFEQAFHEFMRKRRSDKATEE